MTPITGISLNIPLIKLASCNNTFQRGERGREEENSQIDSSAPSPSHKTRQTLLCWGGPPLQVDKAQFVAHGAFQKGSPRL